MGIEIPVPSAAKFSTPTIRIPLYKEMSEVSRGKPSNSVDDRWFQLTKRPDGDYVLHNIDYLREALEYLYATPTPKLIKDIRNKTGIDISGSTFMEGECEYSMNARTMNLKIYLTNCQ